MKLKLAGREMVLLRVSAMLTLIALALMIWALLQPTPMPVMIAMSVGQMLGTAAFGAYGYVVFRDLTRKRAERRMSQEIMRRSEAFVRESQEIPVVTEAVAEPIAAPPPATQPEDAS